MKPSGDVTASTTDKNNSASFGSVSGGLDWPGGPRGPSRKPIFNGQRAHVRGAAALIRLTSDLWVRNIRGCELKSVAPGFPLAAASEDPPGPEQKPPAGLSQDLTGGVKTLSPPRAGPLTSPYSQRVSSPHLSWSLGALQRQLMSSHDVPVTRVHPDAALDAAHPAGHGTRV